VEPQQAVAALTVAMTTTVTTPSIPPAPAPVSGSQAAVVEIPDNDTPPPGWDQWGSLPAPAPEGDLVFWGKPSCPLTLLI
jgi:hypothetical protein